MDSPNIEKAISLLSSILDCPADSISENDTIETVEKWDSLNHMRLILKIEEEYKAEVDPDTALGLFTVKDIAAYISTL
ncbi:acyl carrier protein [Sneathiella glossodoripedis]|uniref:acyl carrier protein n=1 Tax=Sneathiella glossodoripedis TaxID=418853 RepID=UPI000472BDCF|nr:acyl carrier protein [Sneathiella glossodoripedis]